MESRDEKKDRPDGSAGRNSDDRRTPGGGNLIFLLFALAVAVILLLALVTDDGKVRLSYSDFVLLIEQIDAEHPQSAASIKVQEGSGKRERTVEYSAPEELRIGPNEITGTLNRQIVAPPELAESSEQTRVTFETPRRGLVDDGSLSQMLSERNVKYSGTSKPHWFVENFVMLLFMAAFALLLFYMLRRLSGAGSPMAFGRSRGKLYAQEGIGITFDDVAGIDEAVDELREVVEFLRSPEKYQRLGGRIPKGVLLVGPPGTGKTMLAKAIAGEASVPFFSLSGSDFVEMFVGVGAARVRDMFGQAESKAPCIIFIDELDALGKTRGASMVGGQDEREQTLNALLVEMDGFESNNGVVVIGATNRPETLDPALLRPGRFDRHVLVDRPDVRGREKILKVHVQKVKLDESVSTKKVAELTPGLVGADLANLVNEAALLAARKDKSAVGMDEFNEGVERVMAGLEKKQRLMHEDEKQRVAYHESGHALVAYSLPNTDPVHKVSIIPRGMGLGYVLQRPEGDRFLITQSELEARIQIMLAGTVAEELIFDDVSTGAQNDLERASQVARSMVMDYGMSRLGRVTYRESTSSQYLAAAGEFRALTHSEQTAREIDNEVHRIIGEAINQVRDILTDRRDTLEALAQVLIEQETISGDELRDVIEKTSPSPSIVPGTKARREPVRSDEEVDAADEPAEGGATGA